MWKIIIELLEKWWKDKPRKDVVRAVIRLRDAMQACQTAYQTSMSAKLGGETKTGWFRALKDLADAVGEIDDVLAIFSPQAHARIGQYLNAEGVYYGACDALETAATDLQQSLDIDFGTYALDERFVAALAELDTFVRTNFKIEEIHRSHKTT